MKFYSTKKVSPEVSFKTALFQGLAPDGGLYMPSVVPVFEPGELESLSSTTLQEIGYTVLRKWISAEEIPDSDLKEITEKALNFPIPIEKVGKYFLLELFHGPTMAFKDIAARVLAQLFEYFLEKDNKEITVLVATSGDTGGAMAQAFSGMKRVKLVILYPEGKVSALQEEQLTRVGDNIFPIVINGVFDDCQKYVKQAFQDDALTMLHLSSANSINIGRLISQIIYYVWAYLQLKSEHLQFVVPSGNMGNATAALFARKMGVKIASLVIATNENDAVVTYYKTGEYKGQATQQTLSTAMDIGNPSNFERILKLFDYNHDEFCKMITAMRISDDETMATIKKIYKDNNYLLDFHTAVAYSAAEKTTNTGRHSVVVSTASPLKFAKEMYAVTGIQIDDTPLIAKLQKVEKKVYPSENAYNSVKRIILKKLA